jgi:hypothetical protein
MQPKKIIVKTRPLIDNNKKTTCFPKEEKDALG